MTSNSTAVLVTDSSGYTVTMNSEQYNQVHHIKELLYALSYGLLFSSIDFLMGYNDLDYELDGYTYYLYYGDVLLRTYDPSESIFSVNCFFEENEIKDMQLTNARILIAHAGYRS